MPKTRFCPFLTTASPQWLKNAEAAEALAVSERTIKHWMTRADTREALGAVRHGKQHRIPRPDNKDHWRSDVRWRLKRLGTQLKPVWKRKLQKIAKRSGRHYLESCRLWLAATLTALEHGDFTQNAKDAALWLKKAADKILDPLPCHQMEVSVLKSEFPPHFAALGFSQAQVDSIMSYWPEKRFEQVHAAHTLEELEVIRSRLDYAQAVRRLEQGGQNPTGELVRPLLHGDIMAHINDTGEQLPGKVIKPGTPDELRRAIEANVWSQIHSATPRRSIETPDAQGRTHVRSERQGANQIIDLRKPQDGLALRTFRRRHPSRKSPQREIVATIYGVMDRLPGAG